MARVAINGFGRIGRTFFRSAFGHPDIEIVAVNDLGSIENLAYLLTYDSVYGRSPFTVSVEGKDLIVDGKRVTFCQEKEPSALPWGAMNIDVVVESTGFFTTYEGSKFRANTQICYLVQTYEALLLIKFRFHRMPYSAVVGTS